MSVILHADTRILFYGAETPHGQRQVGMMIDGGTSLVGVVAAEADRVPATVDRFVSAAAAVRKVGRVDLAVVFSTPELALKHVLDAVAAGVRTTVVTTEYVPVHDALIMKAHAGAAGAMLIGPNSSGILTPADARAGFICNAVCAPGRVGVVAKSGSVAFAAMSEMKAAGLGVSTVVSIGGDLVNGTDYRPLLDLFDRDDQTDSILILGEVGGCDEEAAAEHIAANINKPIVAFVSGRSLRPGQNIGHAGAIVTQARGGYLAKVDSLRRARVAVAQSFPEIVPLLRAANGAGR